MIRCPECRTPLDLRRLPGRDTSTTPIDGVIALHIYGCTNAEIAKVYGISKQRVSAMLKRHK